MLERDHTMLVVVDVQERMMPAIDRGTEVTDQIVRLVSGCRELGIPMLVTEQYSKGLGHTVESVRSAMGEWYIPVEKMTFSACGDLHFMNKFETVNRQHAILCGVETHVCIYQTAMDLFNLGYSVEVAADAVGSRTERNYQNALAKMIRHGIDTTSTEMALFEMMTSADIPEFKAVSAIIK